MRKPYSTMHDEALFEKLFDGRCSMYDEMKLSVYLSSGVTDFFLSNKGPK